MKAGEICTRVVPSCTRETNLAAVGALMGDGGCSLLPVLEETRKVVGVITDRDVCLGAGTDGRPAAEIRVREVIGTRVYTCRPGDEVRDALHTMRTRKVRRLPVVDEGGILQGMLSLDDIALVAKPDLDAGPTEVSYEDLALAMKALSRRRPAERSGTTIWMSASPGRE